jgi:prepilin-type N-terminal cleavage/methylation domain-containing protein
MTHTRSTKYAALITSAAGFTLIEVALVVVITGILITAALRTATSISNTGKYEDTKRKMLAIEEAISGNPALYNNGTRGDFGYVGDIGALPPDLSALQTNPGGLATWNGPYIRGRFQQASGDYAQDAWGDTLEYDPAGSITSNGSGSQVVHAFASSSDGLLRNSVRGSVADFSGVPPGQNFCDSIRVSLSFPDGAGSQRTSTITPEPSGYFQFDSIPIGLHDLSISYSATADSIHALVVVNPSSSPFKQYRFNASLWASGSDLILVHGSDTLSGSPSCTDIILWLANNSGTDRTITSMVVSWPTPTAYFAQIYWGSTLVFDKAGSPRGATGATCSFSSSQTIASGDKARVRILDFRSSNSSGGGSPVSMSNATLTITLSDGTSITEGLPSCP